jgi:hypothetical protein
VAQFDLRATTYQPFESRVPPVDKDRTRRTFARTLAESNNKFGIAELFTHACMTVQTVKV